MRETERERERKRERQRYIYIYIYIHMYTSIERERDSKRQPPFDPSVGSLCHMCITTTHHNSIASYVFKSALRSAKKINFLVTENHEQQIKQRGDRNSEKKNTTRRDMHGK